MPLGADSMRCGDYRTSYKADTTIYPTSMSRLFAMGGLIVLLLCPLVLNTYYLSLLIQIGYLGVAALGLNILMGFSGQISLSHGALFGVGAFSSAWLNATFGIPVLLCIPLAGLMTTAVGMVVGIPSARLKGLYLAIATLAAQFIIMDLFNRLEWFTGGSAGVMASSIEVFGFSFYGDQRYFYIVLFFLVTALLLTSNLLRSRDGRAFIALRDHYLSAEIMGVNLNRYRMLAFALSSFYAGVGGALFAHYLGYITSTSFDLMLSIEFLAMIIIGGVGSIMGTMMGAVFMVLLPQVMTWAAGAVDTVIPAFSEGLVYLKEIAIGLAIVLFLIFEPDGLAHRWKQIKAYWKLYPFSY